MPKQKIEIELDVPDGWELTGEFRQACGEFAMGVTENVFFAHDRTEFNYFIVRKKWQWPEWLKAEWIAMDRDGEWFAYCHEPRISDCRWYGDTPCHVSEHTFDFTPPPCDDWKQSLRRNPNAEATDGNE